jgi:drug/metabolite transporter (DMT)-like permease
MVAFAANSVITRYLVVNGFAAPYVLTTVRFASGFAMLWSLKAIGRITASRGTRHDLVGGTALGVYAFSISFGYAFIPAAAGTLVFYAFVVLTMALFAVLHDGDRLTGRSVVGQILAVLGVVVITFGGIRDVTLPGVALMAVTGTSWGLYSAVGRGASDSQSYTFRTFLVLAVAALIPVPLLSLTAPDALRIAIAWNGLGLALFMGMVSTALSYVLWNATLRRLTASQGGIVQLTVPVVASTMGIVILGEHATATLAIGATAVLAGIYLNRVPRAAQSARGPP